MWTNYEYVENCEDPVVETFYDEYDSPNIKKSICHCGGKRKENVTCTFYGNEDNVLYEISVPNNFIYVLYNRCDGITIINNGESVVFPYIEANETTCYSLTDGSIKWRCPLNDICDIFAYKNKLFAYCIHSSSKGSFQLINANTGEPIKKLYSYNTKLNHPSFHRISDKLLLIYVSERYLIFNMQTEEMFLTRFKHTPIEGSSICNLKNVIPCEKEDSKILLFADYILTFNSGKIDKSGWIKSEEIINISSLLKGAILSPFGDRIPTTKEQIDKKIK